jgi:glycosyltransferase involved in cell wall biosynthesis
MNFNKKLSIVIPCYNEEKTIIALLNKIEKIALIADFNKEIVIVDDCSTDNSFTEISQYIAENSSCNVKLARNLKNQGKGASIKMGIKQATGDCIIIQDADLEYDPGEYNRLLKPVVDGHADVVYGSRFRGSEPHRILFFFHAIGNQFLTFLSNACTGLNLSDMETGYKLFRSDIIKNISLVEQRFGFEPEVTAKLSRIKGIRIYEVGISYYGRTYNEGKKINWKDGLRALYCILKYNFFVRK